MDATKGYIPNVTTPKKKYAHVLLFHPLGFNPVWLMIKLPSHPSKKVNKKRAIRLSSIKPLLFNDCFSYCFRSSDLKYSIIGLLT